MPVAYAKGNMFRFLDMRQQPLAKETEQDRAVLCLNNGKTYKTAKKAGKEIAGEDCDSAARSILKALKGKQETARGRRWVWADSEQPVQVFETGQLFSNAYEAAAAMGSKQVLSDGAKIKDALRGRQRTAFNRHWVEKTEEVPVMCWETERCYGSAEKATAILSAKRLNGKTQAQAAKAIMLAARRGGTAFGYRWLEGGTQ